MAGTIYEAKYYAVFFNFLQLSAIKLLGLISTVPKPSLQSILTVTDKVSQAQLRKYWANTHTRLYFSFHVIRMHERSQNFMKL